MEKNINEIFASLDDFIENFKNPIEYVTIELVDGEKVTLPKYEYDELKKLNDSGKLGEILY